MTIIVQLVLRYLDGHKSFFRQDMISIATLIMGLRADQMLLISEEPLDVISNL